MRRIARARTLLVSALVLLSVTASRLCGQGAAAVPARPAGETVAPGEWMEVTQGVQDADKPVPLVGGRTTWVRVYPVVSGERGAVLRGRLRVQWAGGVDTLPSLGRAHLQPGEAASKDQRRLRWASSLNFLLPSHATAAGTVWLELIDVADAASGRRIPCPDCGRSATMAAFGPPRVLRVKVVGFRRLGPPVRQPREQDFANLRSWLWRAYPVSRVEMETVMVDAPAGKPVCDDINAQLARIRALDLRGGEDPRTRYYGLVRHGDPPDTMDFMTGCSMGVPRVPDPSVPAAGSGGIPYPKETLFGWDEDGSDADWYGGHEIAHTFGLRHPGWCGPAQPRDDPWAAPEDSGRVGGLRERTVALDPLGAQAFGRDRWHDVMTYCANQWVGGGTYVALLKRLAEEDSLYAAGAWLASPQGARTAPAAEDSLLQVVVRFVELGLNAGWIHAVVPVPVRGRPWAIDRAVLDTISSKLKVTIEVAGARDTVRAPGWIMLNQVLNGGSPNVPPVGSGFVNAFVPNVPGRARIRIYREDRFVHETEKSAFAPRREGPIGHTLPQPGAGAAHRFSWTLVDPDGFIPAPMAYVQITYDGGARWHVIQQTWRREYALPCAAIAHRGSARIRLVASDGINTAVVHETPDLVPACRAAAGG